ncbi:hypothetical protein JCM3770_000552 [Rhodotorula araucariae]
MHFIASLLALLSALLLAQAAPAPSPVPVVDRLSIVASNRARLSSAWSASYASVASVASASAASVASASAASVHRASVASVRGAIIASNRSKLAAKTSGFATVTTKPAGTSTLASNVAWATPAPVAGPNIDTIRFDFAFERLLSFGSEMASICSAQTTVSYSACWFSRALATAAPTPVA